jgi:hypothetical protein
LSLVGFAWFQDRVLTCIRHITEQRELFVISREVRPKGVLCSCPGALSRAGVPVVVRHMNKHDSGQAAFPGAAELLKKLADRWVNVVDEKR